MIERNTMLRNPLTYLLAIGLGLFVSELTACGDDVADAEIDQACERYCARAVECGQVDDFGDCFDNCEGLVSDFCVDQEDAVDVLETCSRGTCEEVDGCIIDAGLECLFGISPS
jgi:hypothetical protein